MTHTATQKEYIAVIRLPYGCSSYARDLDKDQAIKRCTKIAVSDWSHLFKVSGAKVNVCLYDITDHDDVWWDDAMWGEGQVRIPVLEKVEVTLPRKR